MTSKERMMRALRRETPDRLPATVHQWQGYHLDHYLGGISDLEAFRMFGLDAAIQYFESMGQFWLPGIPEMPQAADWRVELDHPGRALGEYPHPGRGAALLPGAGEGIGGAW